MGFLPRTGRKEAPEAVAGREESPDAEEGDGEA